MIDPNQKKFLVLYLIPASVVEKWSKTDSNERKAAEEKMRGEWDNWMRAHSKMIVSTDAGGKTKRVTSSGISDTKNVQPSNAKFIFGPSVWLRALIKPEPGKALAYIDWSQQEFGIAAALSRDPLMQKAYSSGDPYLEFAKQAGALPASATKESHGPVRERFKACVLAVQYGMGGEALAARIGQSPAHARELLRLHKETYAGFWRWSDAALDQAMLTGELRTVFGWTVRPGVDPNPRSFRNFPMQANGAEMLRLACILGMEAGIKICAPVHDAILIEAPSDAIAEQVRIMQGIMAKASAIVLGGFELRSDVKIIPPSERYLDPRGTVMWERILELLSTKHPVPPAFSPTSDRAVNHPPGDASNLWLRVMARHPPSRKVYRHETPPVPS